MPVALSHLTCHACSGVNPSVNGKCCVVLSQVRVLHTVSGHHGGVGIDMLVIHALHAHAELAICGVVFLCACHGSDGLVL